MDTIKEEIDDYEPELTTWPYILLGIILPLIPLAAGIYSYLNHGSALAIIYDALLCVAIALPLFTSALITKKGRGRGILLASGLLYGILVLIRWTVVMVRTKSGLGIPLSVALTPSLLGALSYAFYAKRRHYSGYMLSILFSFLLSFLAFYLSLRSGMGRAYAILPAIFVIFSLIHLFVTRRSEASPWFINIFLTMIVFTSVFTAPRLYEMLPTSLELQSIRAFVLFLIREAISSYSVWFAISFTFAYSALGMKSSFRNRPSLRSYELNRSGDIKEEKKEDKGELRGEDIPSYVRARAERSYYQERGYEDEARASRNDQSINNNYYPNNGDRDREPYFDNSYREAPPSNQRPYPPRYSDDRYQGERRYQEDRYQNERETQQSYLTQEEKDKWRRLLSGDYGDDDASRRR